jgi:hypothetical protein
VVVNSVAVVVLVVPVVLGLVLVVSWVVHNVVKLVDAVKLHRKTGDVP